MDIATFDRIRTRGLIDIQMNYRSYLSVMTDAYAQADPMRRYNRVEVAMRYRHQARNVTWILTGRYPTA